MFYSTRKVVLNTSRPRDLECPVCGSVGTIEIEIFRDVLNQWGDPIPLGASHEKDRIKCSACLHVFDSARLPPAIRTQANLLSAQTPTPLRYFSGLLFMLITFLAAIIFGVYTHFSTKDVIDDPKKGDIFETSLNSKYSALKVKDVKGDSVLVEIGQFSYDSPVTDLPGLAQQHFDSAVWVGKDQLRGMYLDKKIIDMARP